MIVCVYVGCSELCVAGEVKSVTCMLVENPASFCQLGISVGNLRTGS